MLEFRGAGEIGAFFSKRYKSSNDTDSLILKGLRFPCGVLETARLEMDHIENAIAMDGYDVNKRCEQAVVQDSTAKARSLPP